MKKQLLFLLALIAYIHSYSQINLEKGYLIDNSNQKTNCFVKNVDWQNNPTEFEYQLTENSSIEKASIETIKEFGIYNTSKYIRVKVKIDRSTGDINNLDYEKKAILKEEILFLKVLVQGNSSLYQYVDNNLNRYFYNKDNSAIEQLIFKNYKIGTKLGENNRYKQQLWNNLKCPTFTFDKIKNIDYNKNELVAFFIEYNKCNNNEFINFEEKQKRNLFNLNIRPGLNYSSLSIQNSLSSSKDAKFNNELTFRFGLEAEFIMPFNKDKWALIVEPTYQYFKSEKELSTQNIKADYTSIELPIGIRHYFFLNSNSKLFFNGSFIFDLSGNSMINSDSGPDLEIRTFNNLAFGLGYKKNDKYSLEFRYHTDRNLLYDYLIWNSSYKTISLIFGYTLF